MTFALLTVLSATALTLDLVTWAAFRLDKRRARLRRRRIPERTLLVLSLAGGLGALAGMYAHRQRHKTRKLSFILAASTGALAQLALASTTLLTGPLA